MRSNHTPNIHNVSFDYKNHRGELKKLTVIPRGIFFGPTDWHEDSQWILTAFDLDKNQLRNFAMKDIKNWKIVGR